MPPPPRTVRGKLGSGIWFGRIFIIPHTLIGIGILIYWIFTALWVFFGSDISGSVIKAEIRYSSKHGDKYELTYQFIAGGKMKYRTDSVSYAFYQRYLSRDKDEDFPVTVHYLSIGPLEKSAMREGGSLWSGYLGLTVILLFWNVVVSIITYQLWVKPLQSRFLYINGQATNGTVISKRSYKGKSTAYYVTYSFQDPYSGKEFEREMAVWRSADWQRAVQGQSVTVLFSRNNPKRSTVYEFGGYEVVR